jgi:hypothetical protein
MALMGLFDKKTPGKRKDDFDSPVEQIDLGAAAPAPAPAPALATPPPAAAVSGAVSTPEPPRAAPPAPRPIQVPRDEPEYGIEKAIELMRTLPQGSVELVVQVVKFTLESAQIKIGTIIEDAASRQDRIQSRISVLRTEINDLEQEISMRRDEIGKLEADYSETTTVKERLQLAEQLSKPTGEITAAPRPSRGTGPQTAATAATTSASASPGGAKPPAASAPGAAAPAAVAAPASSTPGNVKK